MPVSLSVPEVKTSLLDADVLGREALGEQYPVVLAAHLVARGVGRLHEEAAHPAPVEPLPYFDVHPVLEQVVVFVGLGHSSVSVRPYQGKHK